MRSLTEQLLADESGQVARAAGRHHTLVLNRLGMAAMAVMSLLALLITCARRRRSSASATSSAAIEARARPARDRGRGAHLELTELAHHLQTAREDERSRLARELHDELGALLTAAKLDAARIKSRLGDARRRRSASASPT